MIMAVARRELMEHSRSGRVLLLIALNVLLMPLGMYASARDYEARQAVYSQLVRSQQQRLVDVKAMPLHQRARWGWYQEGAEPSLRALRPPSPLSMFTAGLDRRAPSYWQFSPLGAEQGPPPGDIAHDAADGSLDMSASLQILLSLLALIVTVDVIAAEREGGTLRATLAAPIHRADVVIGKWLAAMSICTVAFVAGLCAGALAVQLAAPRLQLGRYILDLAAMAVLGVLFLGAMTGVGLVISASSRSARGALVVGSVLWAGLVFIQPRVVRLVAQVAAPAEPAELLRERRARGIQAVARQRQRELAEVWTSAMGDTPVPTGHFPPDVREVYDRARLPLEQRMFSLRRGVVRNVDDEAARALAARRRVLALLDLTGPVGSLVRGLESISGTGERALAHSVARVGDHQRRLEELAFDRSFGIQVFHPRYQLMISWDGQPSEARDRPPSPAELPGLVLDAETRGTRLMGAVPSAIALATMGLAGVLTACVVLMRRDIVS